MQYLAMREQFLAILNRSDCTDTLAKTFFDQSVSRCQRMLRTPDMERIFSINTTAGTVSQIAVPSDWIETISFVVQEEDGYARELQSVDVGTFMRHSNVLLGAATYYTRLATNFNITDPIPQNATAYLYYYGELTPLVNDTDEPIMAIIAPDMLIYNALVYAADYFIDDRGVGWMQKADALIAEIQNQAADADGATGSQTISAAWTYDDCVF